MKIIDTFDYENSKNIFYYILQNKGEKLEWLTSENFNTMDLEYYLSYSTDKKTSSLYNSLLELENGNHENALIKLSKIFKIAMIKLGKYNKQKNKNTYDRRICA